MEDLEKKLLEELEWEKPRTRLYLSMRLSVPERRIEQLIGELRDKGEPVCSNSETKGYWLSTGEDLARTIKEIEHRGLAQLQRANKMKNRQLKGQVDVWNSENLEQMK